jgi:hypothetical protein
MNVEDGCEAPLAYGRHKYGEVKVDRHINRRRWWADAEVIAILIVVVGTLAIVLWSYTPYGAEVLAKYQITN